MISAVRDTLVDFLRHRKACDLCLSEKCNKKCKHVRNYTYSYIQCMYDEAIAAAVNYESSKFGVQRKEDEGE